jgi:elongation factor G
MAREYEIGKTRNIGIIAHIDAGKTTVTERILYYSGITHKIGEVHEGTAVMDWMAQERERGITITAAATTCYWPAPVWLDPKKENFRINIIDTPGHIDFTVEVQRSLRVLDGAVVVFDGVAGVEPQSETVWRQADKFKVPRICFINKMDRMGADFEKSYESILDKLGAKAVPIQIPIGKEDKFEGIIDLFDMVAYKHSDKLGSDVTKSEIPDDLKEDAKKWRAKMIEMIVETDNELLEKYLDGKEVTNEELYKTLRKSVIKNEIYPVLTGSALKNKGVQPLLDAVIGFLPSPNEAPSIKGHDKNNKKIIIEPKDDSSFVALAFKIAADPFVGKLCFFRVYSGTLNTGSYVLNSSNGKKERIGRILRMHANTREEVKEVFTGDIAAAVGLKDTTTGETLCDPSHPIILEKIKFPEPVISVAIEPKTKADQEKLSSALKRLKEEDPTFRVKVDDETSQTLISGMGELHLEILVDRMKREFDVDATVGKPQVAYKETIRATSEAEGKFIRQTGGRGQYGHVFLKVEPKERGKGFEFIDKIVGGRIPREYIPAVEKGIKGAMQKGIIAGYPVVDMAVTLFDGSYHEVDSSEVAFQIAGSMALQSAVKKADPSILEPIMKLEVICPADNMGDVTGDLNSRRAQIGQITDRTNMKVIDAFVPLSEMFGYATSLRTLTSGRGYSTMEFDHYQDVPKNIYEKLVGRMQERVAAGER